MRSTCCALVIVLAPACAVSPSPRAVSAPEARPPRSARPSARPDVPPDWRRPTEGVRPWRTWQFVPDDQRQRRPSDYDPEQREYRFLDERRGDVRVVPERPGERCPAGDAPRDLAPLEAEG